MDGGGSMDGAGAMDDSAGGADDVGAKNPPPRDSKAPPRPAQRPSDAGKQDAGREMGAMKRLLSGTWFPRFNLTARMERLGATLDAQIVDKLGDELLPTPLTNESRAVLLEFLGNERHDMHVSDGKLLSANPEVEKLLRRLAHLILSLPEAQLI